MTSKIVATALNAVPLASWKGKATGNHGVPNQILGCLGNVALSKRFIKPSSSICSSIWLKNARDLSLRSTQLESQSTRNKSCPLILKMEVQAYVMSLVTWGQPHLPDTNKSVAMRWVCLKTEYQIWCLIRLIVNYHHFSIIKVPVLRYTTVYPTLRHNDITWHNHIILMKLLPINSMLLKSPAKTNNISLPPTNQHALVSWYNLQTLIWGSKIGRSSPYMSI